MQGRGKLAGRQTPDKILGQTENALGGATGAWNGAEGGSCTIVKLGASGALLARLLMCTGS